VSAPGSPLRGAIVAMTRDRVIGVDGKLPWHYPEDLRRFKQRTMNCAIIMGRVTWDSIGRNPLPGRRNIVISRSGVTGAECHPTIAAALNACAGIDTWFIGGAQIYQAAMPYIEVLDVTFVPDKVEGNDSVRFPEIDWSKWKAVEESTIGELKNVVYRLVDD